MPDRDPIIRFKTWFQDAADQGLPEPTNVVLATADKEGRPSARVVLLKGVDERGFVIYTNLESKKGRDMEENPYASLCFSWIPLARQVRVRGPVARVDEAEADAYWATRPRESRLGAWASQQSTALESRDQLLTAFRDVEARYEGQDVPRPPHWTGIRIAPEEIEFWTAGEYRLHDREMFRRVEGVWVRELLYP